MNESQQTRFPLNCVRICFDQYENGLYSGEICGVALKDEIHFTNMENMILKIDEAFNRIGQPQAAQVLRSFETAPSYMPYTVKPTQYHSNEEIAGRQGKIRTFDLIMVSRRHAEWQGELKNTDNTIVGEFQSSLECVDHIRKELQV